MITIKHERYGECTEFNSLDEAQQTIRDCGPEFASVALRLRRDGCVVDDRDAVVGAVTPDVDPADDIAWPSMDDDD